MSELILPVGKKLLVLPKSEEEHFKTDSGLSVVDTTLSRGIVVGVGHEMRDIYKEGDVVVISKKAGTGQFYKGKPHLFLDGRSHPDGDIWAIVGNEVPKKDKGDGL